MHKKIFIPLLLLLTLISCQPEPLDESLVLEEGLYWDGYVSSFARLIYVDKWGERSIEYVPGSVFVMQGFAFLGEEVGSSWAMVDEFESALYYLDNSSSLVKLHYSEDDDSYFIDSPSMTKDWLEIYDEVDKYAESVLVRNNAPTGGIELTKKDEGFKAKKSLIKAITVIANPATGEKFDTVGVRGKELRLLQKNNNALGYDVYIKVDLEKGVAHASLFIKVTIAGLAPV